MLTLITIIDRGAFDARFQAGQGPCRAEGLRKATDHRYRQTTLLGEAVEEDHGKLKQAIGPAVGCPSMKTIYSTLKGFKVTSALSKDRTVIRQYGDCAMGEDCPINGPFGI
ncbi:hypothetical protein [Rhizobium rhizogenes]|uniref:hypothetical protein n=1 Tax=Rhizobium rhizogenes TaxID=359 RepID=UPI001AEDC714|nr:hypothetical protein [Rhizobium rhizogenes]NTF84627.1 hypothetical protein [Rhizobium rhizogenes]